jgi:hypothetical protein
MKAPATETEKPIDKTTSSGFRFGSRGNSFRAKLTPCGHRSDKNRNHAAKEQKQNLKHCKQLRKLYSKQLTKGPFNKKIVPT